MDKKSLNSRREFLRHIALLGGVGAIAAACRPKAAQEDCTDVSGLSDADKQMRTTLQYAEKSPDSAKVCGGCNFFQKPARVDGCGRCTLVKGPIATGGHCTSWIQKAS